ncbi:alpha-glucan family phosphorylase [Robiginitalea sp. M366]|uniref:alpha-glucan family phosphorylase n=1 Tax=Robiginitalea aestuariiviva TaxID=3036903 RepID=UPI00240D2DDA|nr:alpha-glucan family phosphorylase [Robiginitalea aestuariiviva]MDG1570873.1 alpha-glucan family phosphorylase [Robiginitalea aestuariiviva]
MTAKASPYHQWHHPYKPAAAFSTRVAYFSMEFGIDQALKIYSGGLGFLAGSHLRSAFDLKQNLIGVGMLWKYGYYDQTRNADRSMRAEHILKRYDFLEDTGLEVQVTINDNPHVKVRAYVLRPEIFGTVPLYLLSTDLPENDHLSRTITDRLYDPNDETRISQSIVLGIGGAKLVEMLGGAQVYHLNEGHALPAFYYLRDRGVDSSRLVFTTHTPEKGGNEVRNGYHLNNRGFFGRTLPPPQLQQELVGDELNFTVSALRHSKKANAVSRLHAKVAQGMWEPFGLQDKIIPITNAQHPGFWTDPALRKAFEKKNLKAVAKRKRELKAGLFNRVLDQTGKMFDPEVLTVVWARRFAGYKRADLLLRDFERFQRLMNHSGQKIQIIWAGKPYPEDYGAIHVFNRLVEVSWQFPNMAVMTGYEMELSRMLKEGSDVWLNNPRITREASGTSGMTAAMNGSVNLTVNDGWIPEFGRHGENAFILPEADPNQPHPVQDDMDARNLYRILEEEVLPMYYQHPDAWNALVMQGMEDVVPAFSSHRMATDYYKKLYKG